MWLAFTKEAVYWLPLEKFKNCQTDIHPVTVFTRVVNNTANLINLRFFKDSSKNKHLMLDWDLCCSGYRVGFRRKGVCGRCVLVKYLAFSMSLKWCPSGVIPPFCLTFEIVYPQQTLIIKTIGVSFCKHLLVLYSETELLGIQTQLEVFMWLLWKNSGFFSGRKIFLREKSLKWSLFQRAPFLIGYHQPELQQKSEITVISTHC